jgi:membrane fusion protein (multidrug efflux system)
MNASAPSSLAFRFAPFVLSALAVACTSAKAAEKAAPSPAVAVTTVDVSERTVPNSLVVTGSLLANRESEVAADAPGRVIAVKGERGSFVKQGELLAQLDAGSAVLNRKVAAADVSAAAAREQHAALECERSQRLFEQKVISQAEIDRSKADCDTSRFAAAGALARQNLAAKAISDSSIRAPFSGMIVDRAVEVGEYLNPGRRVATIVELNPLRLELTVPESAATSVKAGGQVEFTVKAFANERFNGSIRYVGPVLRRATRDLVVEALVDNESGRLRPGMFAEASIAIGERKVLVVPKSALVGSPDSPHAFVVSGGVAEERVLLAGQAVGDSVAILSGLRAGERLITSPSEEVRDGVRVR